MRKMRHFIAGGLGILFFAPVALLLALSAGPPPNRSGVTGTVCTACHVGNPLNSPGGTVRIIGLPPQWIPGQTYFLQVVVTRAGARRHGFQLTAVDSNVQQAGTFTAGSDGRTRVVTAVVNGASLEHIQHTSAGSTIDSSNTFGFSWRAPASSSVGNVRFNVAANAASGDGSNRGDFVYASEVAISPQPNTISLAPSLSPAEQVPPITGLDASGSASITVSVNRGSSGTITSGTVAFEVDYRFPAGTTITGLHVHKAARGSNGPIVIDSGIGTVTAITNAAGRGTLFRVAAIGGSDSAGLATLESLIADPTQYYVNVHTATHPDGALRGQLEPQPLTARETYHFRPDLSPANEIPRVTSTATGVAWLKVGVNRDASGVITSGSVTFDVDYNTGSATTFTGLHIHRGSSSVNGPVVIDSGLSASSPEVSTTGMGNITRTVEITSAAGLAVLADLIRNPGGFYVNLHTTTNPSGFIRSQLLQFASFAAQVAGGADWSSSMTITNPSATDPVQGLVNFFDTAGRPMPPGVVIPTIPFLIPPAGSVTLSTNKRGTLTAGPARIHSNAPVTVDVEYSRPGLTSSNRVRTVVGNSVSIPVSVSGGGVRNTGIALQSLEDSDTTTIVFTLTDANGTVIPGGIGGITLAPGEHLASFVTELLPSVSQSEFSGTLKIDMLKGPFAGGVMAVLGMQFDAGTLTPVTVSILR